MKFLWLGLLLILVVLGASSYIWLESSLKPASSDSALHTFSIEVGDPGSTILRKLADAHLIRSYYAARIYYLLSDKHTVFRPGI